MSELKVFVCNSSSMVRRLLKGLLEQDTGVKVIGEAPDGASCIEQVAKQKPDLVVMDLNLGSIDAPECMRRLQSSGVMSQVIVVSEHAKPGEARTREALDLGAVGFVTRPHSVMQMADIQPDLSKLLRRVLAR